MAKRKKVSDIDGIMCNIDAGLALEGRAPLNGDEKRVLKDLMERNDPSLWEEKARLTAARWSSNV